MSWASSSAEKPAIGTTREGPKGPDPCATASPSLCLCSHFFVAASVGASASCVSRNTWMAAGKGSEISDLEGG